MPIEFGEEAKRDRDRRLRRSILEVLYLTRGTAPLKGVHVRAVVAQVNASVVSELRIEDDRHAMGLAQDLADAGYVTLDRKDRPKAAAPSPDNVLARITNAGSKLYRAEVDPDPDVWDPRATGDEE